MINTTIEIWRHSLAFDPIGTLTFGGVCIIIGLQVVGIIAVIRESRRRR